MARKYLPPLEMGLELLYALLPPTHAARRLFHGRKKTPGLTLNMLSLYILLLQTTTPYGTTLSINIRDLRTLLLNKNGIYI